MMHRHAVCVRAACAHGTARRDRPATKRSLEAWRDAAAATAADAAAARCTDMIATPIRVRDKLAPCNRVGTAASLARCA